MSLDESVFRFVNGWPDGLGPLLTPFSSVSGSPLFKYALALLVLVMVFRGGRARRAAILSLIAFPISDGLCNLAKHLHPVHRPFQILPDVVTRVGRSDSMGTASSHAANLAAVATVMTLVLGPRWGAVWIVAAILTGFSRVYVGVHFPSQVLLGWAIGALLGWLTFAIARRVVPIRPETEGRTSTIAESEPQP